MVLCCAKKYALNWLHHDRPPIEQMLNVTNSSEIISVPAIQLVCQKCHCKEKLEGFVLCKDKGKRKTSSVIHLSETGTVGWLRFALQCWWHLTDRASNRKSILMIYGKTNCQEIYCAKSFWFFFLSKSFTAVGDEEKFELGKGDGNITIASNEKQSLCGASV